MDIVYHGGGSCQGGVSLLRGREGFSSLLKSGLDQPQALCPLSLEKADGKNTRGKPLDPRD
jgi:hypothetical protein